MVDQLEPHKTAVLLRVGRNVVIFARLEAQISSLAARTRISVGISLPDMKPIQVRSERKRKLSLGKLLDQLCANLFEDQEPLSPPRGYGGAWASHSFRIEMPKSEQKEWKRDLLSLVRERNHLIHAALAPLDLNSVEATRAFSEHLDDQYDRLGAAIEKLNGLAYQYVAFIKEAQQSMEAGNYSVVERNPSDVA